jgi:hypothetical protein
MSRMFLREGKVFSEFGLKLENIWFIFSVKFGMWGVSDSRAWTMSRLCLREGKVFNVYDLSLKIVGSYLV